MSDFYTLDEAKRLVELIGDDLIAQIQIRDSRSVLFASETKMMSCNDPMIFLDQPENDRQAEDVTAGYLRRMIEGKGWTWLENRSKENGAGYLTVSKGLSGRGITGDNHLTRWIRATIAVLEAEKVGEK